MTPDQQILVIRAVLGPCSAGCYDGVVLGPRYDVDVNDNSICPHCEGAGATLRDATRESWPAEWWRCDDPVCQDGADCPVAAPFVPDFPKDPAAAVKAIIELRMIMNCQDPQKIIVTNGRMTGAGDSPGAALLDALEAQAAGV